MWKSQIMRVVLQLLLLTVVTSGAFIKRSGETEEQHREKRATKQCKLWAGLIMEEGSTLLRSNCRRVFTCSQGHVGYSRLSCPKHSSCKNFRCICDPVAEVTKTTHDGLVQHCEPKLCKPWGGMIIEEGSFRLTSNCKEVFTCSQGKVEHSSFSCPKHSSCKNDRCVCNPGMEERNKTHGGLVQHCGPKQCKLSGGMIMEEGSTLLTSNCRRVFTCSQGNVGFSKLSCPKHSSCKNLRCVCDPGTEVTKTTHDGLVQHCEH